MDVRRSGERRRGWFTPRRSPRCFPNVHPQTLPRVVQQASVRPRPVRGFAMLAMFQCVAEAVKNKGFRGLCEMVPGGSYLLDVAGDAFRLLRERRRAAELREEMAKVAAASTEEAKKVAEEVA